MSRFLLSFVVCLLLNSHFLFAQTQLSEPKDNMKGVKSLNIYLYKVYDVETKKDAVTFYKKAKTIAHSLLEYDTNGNQTLQSYYHQETDKVQESYVYEYDTNHRRIKETYILQGKIQGGKSIFSYNKQGKKEKTLIFSDKDESKGFILFAYDSAGNLISEKTYNTIYMVIKEIQYKYDERNNLIEKRQPSSSYLKDVRGYAEVRSYDDSNRLIVNEYYNEKDLLTRKYMAKYDAKNRLAEEETKDRKGRTISYAIYTYNKKGQMTTSYNYDIPQKSPPMRIEYKYDKKGQNTVRYIYVQDAKKPTITKRYYYDEKGNWTMWYEINHEENVQAIANRKIIYF